MSAPMLFCQSLSESFELMPLEGFDAQGSPGLRSTDQGSEHQLENRPLAKQRARRPRASTFFPKEPLQEVGRARRPAVPGRQVQVSNAGLEVLFKAAHRGRELVTKAVHEVLP